MNSPPDGPFFAGAGEKSHSQGRTAEEDLGHFPSRGIDHPVVGDRSKRERLGVEPIATVGCDDTATLPFPKLGEMACVHGGWLWRLLGEIHLFGRPRHPAPSDCECPPRSPEVEVVHTPQ